MYYLRFFSRLVSRVLACGLGTETLTVCVFLRAIMGIDISGHVLIR